MLHLAAYICPYCGYAAEIFQDSDMASYTFKSGEGHGTGKAAQEGH